MNYRSAWTRGLALLSLTTLAGAPNAAHAAEPGAQTKAQTQTQTQARARMADEAGPDADEALELMPEDVNIGELLELPDEGEASSHPRLELDVPLGHSTRAVADFVTDFVTSGVVLNDETNPVHDRVHRVRGSYRRGALALSWRVSF